MTSEIRIADLNDLTSVQAIVEAAYSPYVERMGRKPGPMLDDYAQRIRDRQLRVLDRSGTICGILVLERLDDVMLLDNIAVAPAAQGSGVGRQLMIEAESLARAEGCSTIQLYTNVMMTENIALYGRIGYVETHRGEEKGLHRVYFSKKLADA